MKGYAMLGIGKTGWIEKEAPKCPYCLEEVAEGATRCPHCTAELPAPAKATVKH